MSDTATQLEEGISLLKRGRTAKALDLFMRVNKANPGSAVCLSYLGVTMALVNKNFKDAEDYCFRATLKNMGNAQLHANLAWVYHLQGKRKNAVESIEQALERDPDNADAIRIQNVMGKRQRPAIGSLSRDNPVNKALGKLIHKLKKP